MIKEVTFYQAQCDMCGQVDDGGEHAAWSEPDHARMTAVDSEWTEIEVRVSVTQDGPHIYTYSRDRLPNIKKRSILICETHPGAGIHWCKTCEDDLDPDKWDLWTNGNRLSQTCPNRHENRIDLIPVGG